MKIIFSLISLIAVVYLSAQTKFVQNLSDSFVERLNSAEVEEASAKIDTKLSKEFAQINPLNNKQNDQKLTDLEQQLSHLQHQNGELNDKIKSLVNKIENLHAMLGDTTTDEDFAKQNESTYTESSASESMLINQLASATEQPDVVADWSSATTQAVDQNQQDKRVQQQAILRELSQRMELTSLRSLTQ